MGGWAAVINLESKPDGTKEVRTNGGIDGLLEAFGLKEYGIAASMESMDNPRSSVPDMNPGSTFYKNHVREVKYTWKWKKVWIFRIPVRVSTSVVWQLPTNPKYGFIVGEDSDILKMIDNVAGMMPTPGLYPLKTPAGTLNRCYQMATSYANAAWYGIEIYYNTRAVAAWFNYGKFWDRNPYKRARRYANNARDWRHKAKNAYEWSKSYQSRIAQIMGTDPVTKSGKISYGHDCLIPVRDQYIDVAVFGGKYVDVITKGKYTGTTETFNHAEELKHPDIWGTKGGMSTKEGIISMDGILWRWMYRQSASPMIAGETVK